MLAITFFEKRYGNDPLLLQYAHRVLEQHPVNLTFFFVPQVVQALRHDDLGMLSSPCEIFILILCNNRLCLPIRLRNLENITAFLPSNYMEHESQLLQR